MERGKQLADKTFSSGKPLVLPVENSMDFDGLCGKERNPQEYMSCPCVVGEHAVYEQIKRRGSLEELVNKVNSWQEHGKFWTTGCN